MLYCEKCRVNVTGKHKECPLCQGDLIEKRNNEGFSQEKNVSQEKNCSLENTFPIIHKKKHLVDFILKITALVTIAMITASVLVNIAFGGFWSIYVVFGAITLWTVILITRKMHGNIAKNTIWLTAIISILSLVWDLLTGYVGWATDFVIPLICCLAMLEMAIVSSILKLRIEDYIVYLIIDILFGIVPLVLLLLDIVKIPYPSLLCVLSSILSLSTLILFEGKALKAEIIRRIHL